MINVNYQKRKNLELFKSLENPSSLFLSKTQNYIPIYKRFFSLNDTNYNSINLNHKWFISSVNEKIEDLSNVYNCKIKHSNNNKTKEKDVFFKMAPLLDPYKYLIGKYNTQDSKLFKLPDYNSDESNTNIKFMDYNNSGYVDGLFLFLNSCLINEHKFIHGVDYYGSFLAIKKNFIINVFDDIDYLNNSDFFNKNKNILFKIDDYSHLFQNESVKLKPLKIEYNSSAKSYTSIQSFNDDLFEDIFEKPIDTFDLNDLKDMSIDLIDITNGTTGTNKTTGSNEPKTNLADIINDTKITLKSNSTCSSRSSHTNDSELDVNCGDEIKINKTDDTYVNDEAKDEAEDDEDDDESYEEEIIDATISEFPVQVIAMEFCENTFDELILTNELKPDEWFSAFMQIIMILISYQKLFSFTHNDLHTNNVMYNFTDKKFIYYCYKKIYYKVPTFGRIFKIIDFGRSIYKFNGNLFCSDSFQNGGDASTQYNTEPYFNEAKPRLEPNYSFDICRLACSIFDYVIEDLDEIKEVIKNDPVKRLIYEWCLDDKGINLLYKNNGVDRYPEFKLYKMISRCVHNHTPQAQLDRPEFKTFSVFKGELPNDVIDIDKMPVYI